ncbi:hypothetical protein [Salinarchaeum laminariae]|uniref:hypothetical protein n=1 Tax=Salinarchaeum laminariae TaxID=869888 RepID=UPI0020BDE65F|nr:hypothetical protein [Salinarchaeum laminariae]
MISFGQKLVAFAVVIGLNLLFFSLSLAYGAGFLLLIAILFAVSSGAFVLRLRAV